MARLFSLPCTDACSRKEFFEACEFVAQVRAQLCCGAHVAPPSAQLIEIAGGHGLVGILLACLERRRFPRVVIADRHKPPSFAVIRAAAAAVAPWVDDCVEYQEVDISTRFARAPKEGGHREHPDDERRARPLLLPHGCAVVCVHACKSLTDEILHAAMEARAESIAAMPCCYGHSHAAESAPTAIRGALGVAVAADIQRTYDLVAAGYTVQWRYIPAAITPMNRILLAKRLHAAEGE